MPQPQKEEKVERPNLLRRNTPFAANIRFRCDLPEPPSDAKLLIAPLDPEKLAAFSITSLERNPRRELMLEPGLGIHLGLLDTSAYSVTDPHAQLAPEDLALLEGETDFTTDQKGHKKVRERLRGSKAELSWLMKTTYISNEMEARRQAGAPALRQDTDANGGLTADEAHLRDAEASIAIAKEVRLLSTGIAVQASFEAAQQAPVHPSDPSLTAVEITPVLPDFDRWGDNFVLIDFEGGDPTADHPRLSSLDPSKRQQLAGEAVVKSYALPGADNRPFLAYMVPKEPDLDEIVDDTEDREPRTGEYEWIREYQYEVSNTRDVGMNATYLMQFEDGQCKYLDLNTRMKCNKRTRGAQGADPRTEFPRPSKITVRNRDRTETETEARKTAVEQGLKGQ